LGVYIYPSNLSGGAEVSRVTRVALTGKERSAKKMLDAVVKFLNVQDGESLRLWTILTALRGPDQYNEDLKSKTTSRLRHAVGLKKNINFSTSDERLSRYPVDMFSQERRELWHFIYHFNEAVKVLTQMKSEEQHAEQEKINRDLDTLTNQFNNTVDHYRK
jgi:hypothetical protein